MRKKGGGDYVARMEPMKTIDALGKPCPIPVIEAKKALAAEDADGVLAKVDNFAAVQNLEKMANGFGYSFFYTEKAQDFFEVLISKNERGLQEKSVPSSEHEIPEEDAVSGGLVVVIGTDTLGKGADELGKILIKGFIYSLTELPVPPKSVIFLNTGAYLTAKGSNTLDDLKKIEENGSVILTCGTCVNYYGLQDKLAVGAITDMYGITEFMAGAARLINL
jgi:selenium metabolism protein YedF